MLKRLQYNLDMYSARSVGLSEPVMVGTLLVLERQRM